LVFEAIEECLADVLSVASEYAIEVFVIFGVDAD
jgi:hypothetical protein